MKDGWNERERERWSGGERDGSRVDGEDLRKEGGKSRMQGRGRGEER